MINLRTIFFISITLFAFLNCTAQKSIAPKAQVKSFKLEYRLGIGKTVNTGTQATTVTISDTTVHLFRNYPIYDPKDTTFYLSKNNRDELISVIHQSDFFSLDEKYINTTQSHYNTQTIKVNIDNNTNSVSVCCLEEDKNPLNKIIAKLYELIPAMKVKEFE